MREVDRGKKKERDQLGLVLVTVQDRWKSSRVKKGKEDKK